jgi:aryl-alcohol dehydrogenase-like predicted oxidoreductase
MIPASGDVTARTGEPISRRDVIQGAVAVGLGLALRGPGALGADGAALPLITKTIPSTGEQLPVIGIGTNQFSVSTPEELEARRAVIKELPRLGGKLIDTARAYGDAEVVIGKMMKELGSREQLFIATKTPMYGEIPPGAEVVEQALMRLQTSRIDLLQIHNFYRIDALFPVLLDAKKAGKIRYVGATTSSPGQSDPQMLEVLKSRPVDFIQVNYSIEDRAAEDVLKAAHDKGVAVLVNLPLGRRSLLPKVKDRPLPDWAKEIDATSWAQVLLKYIVSHPAVTATMPGTTKLEHLQDNEQAGRGRLADAALRKKMEDYWASL